MSNTDNTKIGPGHEDPEGGPGVERKCPVFRCMACGRSFDEVEAEEAAEERSFT